MCNQFRNVHQLHGDNSLVSCLNFLKQHKGVAWSELITPAPTELEAEIWAFESVSKVGPARRYGSLQSVLVQTWERGFGLWRPLGGGTTTTTTATPAACCSACTTTEISFSAVRRVTVGSHNYTDTHSRPSFCTIEPIASQGRYFDCFKLFPWEVLKNNFFFSKSSCLPIAFTRRSEKSDDKLNVKPASGLRACVHILSRHFFHFTKQVLIVLGNSANKGTKSGTMKNLPAKWKAPEQKNSFPDRDVGL